MIVAENCFCELNNSPVRRVRGRVELYEGSTLLQTFKHTDLLREFSIERVGDNTKFFGYGIVHRLNVKIIDTERKLNITTANTLDVAFGVGCEFIYCFPLFRVSEVHRDENTNELSITAYDALYKADELTVDDLTLPVSYTLEVFASQVAAALGVAYSIAPFGLPLTGFELSYATGANFEGTETLREALNALAEATQTIYYCSRDNALTFRRLNLGGGGVITISKDKYFSLDSKTNRRLVEIVAASELGDNVAARLDVSGTTQYIRDNPFWDLRDDVGTLVETALTNAGGLTINQFECEWRGNFLVEIGDRIALETKDDNMAYSYLLDDTITYNGGLTQKTRWNYEKEETETAANPATLGETLKQTYARVDKANKEISLLVSDMGEAKSNITSLMLNADSMTATVEQMKEATTSSLDTVFNELSTITNKVEAAITAEDVSIEVSRQLTSGVDAITTKTGYTFNEEGLTVSKSDSEITTQITENGMTVDSNGSALLTANNEGVNAANLHATTYLIIGTNSRFEDYGTDRTGCFWIGG